MDGKLGSLIDGFHRVHLSFYKSTSFHQSRQSKKSRPQQLLHIKPRVKIIMVQKHLFKTATKEILA